MKLDANGFATPEEFDRIAEATRLRVEELVKEEAMLADPRGDHPAHECAALFWAQLSGVVTAAANGLAGLSVLARDKDRIRTMKQALHDQFDTAFDEALRQKLAGRPQL